MEVRSLLRERNGLKMKLREDKVKCPYSGILPREEGEYAEMGRSEQDPEKKSEE